MKMINKIATCTVSLVFTVILASDAHAVDIEISNVKPANSTFSGFQTTVGPIINQARTLSFTRTFDFDGGGVEDTLSFDLIYRAYNGSTFDGSNVTLGNPTSPSFKNNWANNSFDGGRTLFLELTNINYVDGEGGPDAETVEFLGFKSLLKQNPNSRPTEPADYYIGLTDAHTIPTVGGTQQMNLSPNGSSYQLYFTAAAGAGIIRLRDLDLAFQTIVDIPEPTTCALLVGISGLAFAVTRRRRRRRRA